MAHGIGRGWLQGLWLIALTLALGVAPASAAQAASADDITSHLAHIAHPGDALKRGEHEAMLRLVPAEEATFTSRASGLWTDAATWDQGRAPDAGARVLVRSGHVVQIDSRISDRSFGWVRVSGTLTLSTELSTELNVATLVVDEDGLLQLGSEQKRLSPKAQSVIRFTPRDAASRARDPYDLGGGMIAHGVVRLFGASKSPFILPISDLAAGTREFKLSQPAVGWLPGDLILVPGTSADEDQDETIALDEVSSDGSTIRLASPLKFAHESPQGQHLVPVANLTRNIVFTSQAASPLPSRGHIMFMHRQTGVVVEGVAFLDLGRTDALHAQTIPQLDTNGRLKPGTDDNTIGRYAVHFHARSGASIADAPQVFRDNVIIGSPKLGLVNHGGNVVADGNVTFRVAGSHFFAENGSEIGSFTNNLAVRSTGSGDRIRARDMTYDFGHGGHGFWSQSGGVRMAGNFAFGHAEGAYVIFGYPFLEHGRVVFFDSRNLGNLDTMAVADQLGQVLISNVSFRFESNVAAASRMGLEIWNHKIYSKVDSTSLVDGFTAWNVKDTGVFLPYAKNIALRHVKLYSDPEKPTAKGVSVNTMAENLSFEDLHVDGFNVGIEMPRRGMNSLRAAVLRNARNIDIASANKPGRVIDLADLTFEPLRQPSAMQAIRQALSRWWHNSPDAMPGEVDVYMRDRMMPENGDLAMLFEADHITLEDQTGRHRLYFESQMPDTVVLRDEGPSALRGLTAAQLSDRFQLAVGGVVAPRSARPMERSIAWMAPADEDVAEAGSTASPIGAEELYPMASRHFARGSQSTTVADLWKVAESQSTKVVFVDHEPPKFHFLPGLRPFQIHPDDIQYGYRIMGMVTDKVGSRITVRAFAKEFDNLKVDADGYVRVSFTVSDMAGNETKTDVALLVTDKAVRRGANINFFVQKDYCGQCGYDTLYQDIAKMYDMEEGKISFVPQG